VDKNTRAYISQVEGCAAVIGIVSKMKKLSDVEAADAITTARDTCDNVRNGLPTMNTDHFDDQQQPPGLA